MGRIEERLSVLRARGKKALVFFVTAGFPERDSTPDVAAALQEGGADMLEIGMPFSDPPADGPAIQNSSARALKNGVGLATVLEAVRRIRTRSAIPLVLMGYLNPILTFGAERFFAEAAKAGVDGIILPELPLEETHRFKAPMEANGLSQVLLVAPTTSDDRMARIDAASRGFLYCVSLAGVTGSSRRAPLTDYLERVRRHASRNPVLVGFGISNPDDAASMAGASDGVIIGSALVRILESYPSSDVLAAWARTFREALDRTSGDRGPVA